MDGSVQITDLFSGVAKVFVGVFCKPLNGSTVSTRPSCMGPARRHIFVGDVGKTAPVI